MELTMTHKAVAGSADGNPNALRPQLDGERHELEFTLGQVLASLRTRTISGSGEEGDELVFTLEGFDRIPEGTVIAVLDLAVGTVVAERVDLIAMAVDPENATPGQVGKLVWQSNRDLTDTKTDAVVELEVGSVPMGS